MAGNPLRGTLLIGSTLALLAGSGVASGQIRIGLWMTRPARYSRLKETASWRVEGHRPLCGRVQRTRLEPMDTRRAASWCATTGR
jgi:hypothetical protein